MPNWKIAKVNVRLEYTVRRNDPESAGAQEVTRAFPIEEFVATDLDQFDGTPGQAILGLENVGSSDEPRYQLFRLTDDAKTTFDFDDSANQLKRLSGRFRVMVTLKAGGQSNKQITRIFPFAAKDDKRRTVLPAGLEWEYLVKRDPDKASVYYLLHNTPSGPGPLDVCEQLNCRVTTDPEIMYRCFVNRCYS